MVEQILLQQGCVGIANFDNVDVAVNYLKNFGIWAPLVAFLLFFVQAVFPVFPYFILAGAAGLVFGFEEGLALSWGGALAGACFVFYLVRMTGWDWLQSTIYRRFKLDIGHVNPGVGFWSIFLCRVLPIVPTPLINVISAISGVSFWIFFIASALGKIPTAVIYTGIGNHIYASQDVWGAAGILAAVLLVSYLGVKIVRRRGYF